MNKIVNIILSILITLICVICGILSIAFIFIEGRLLFSLDWIVYENVVNAFIRYLFRFLLAVFALGVMVLEIVNLKNKHKVITYYLMVFDFSLLLMSIILLFLATNYVGVICLILMLLKIVFKISKILIVKRSKL